MPPKKPRGPYRKYLYKDPETVPRTTRHRQKQQENLFKGCNEGEQSECIPSRIDVYDGLSSSPASNKDEPQRKKVRTEKALCANLPTNKEVEICNSVDDSARLLLHMRCEGNKEQETDQFSKICPATAVYESPPEPILCEPDIGNQDYHDETLQPDAEKSLETGSLNCFAIVEENSDQTDDETYNCNSEDLEEIVSLNNDSAPTRIAEDDSELEDGSDSEDEFKETPDFFMSQEKKVQLLLLLETKIRHKLTYTASEDIMKLAGVLSDADDAFLPTRYLMKDAIKKFSCPLTEHHLCPHCQKYVGIVKIKRAECQNCKKEFDAHKNKLDRNIFLYLSLKDQFKILLESCISEDDIIDPNNREKASNFNYEDISDGKRYKKLMKSGEYMSFSAFVDGVQIADCRLLEQVRNLPGQSLFPLMNWCYIRGGKMMACIWLSKKKPCCNEYLKPFVQECKELFHDGLTYFKHGIQRHKKFICLVCVSDSVARPMLRNSTQFNGRYGCGLCLHRGIRMAYLRGFIRSYSTKDAFFQERKHEETMAHAAAAFPKHPKKGMKGLSILSEIPKFDIVRSLDLDLFHALVNVAKRFVYLWFDDKLKGRPFYIGNKISEVNQSLLAITPTSDVSRTPRSILERSDWRGHEWFYFVVVYSIPILKNILQARYLNHWSQLVNGIALIMQNSVAKSELEYADRYLKLFVAEIDDLYGPQHVTFSIHLLTHLKSSTVDYAQPWTHSAFIYESFNSEIKEAVKSSNGVAQQIAMNMQLKIAVKKLKEDVEEDLNQTHKAYLANLKKSGRTLADADCYIGQAALLGKPTISSLAPEQLQALRRARINCNPNGIFSSYERCKYHNEVFQSMHYSKVSKKNNSFLMLKSQDIFQISSFVVVCNQCFVLGYFYVRDHNFKLCNKMPPHFIPLKNQPEAFLRCISIEEVESLIMSFTVNLSATQCIRLACINVLKMEMLT